MTDKLPKASGTLVDFIFAKLDDRKASNIQILGVEKLTDVTDYMVIATGNTTRQVGAIADHLVAEAKKDGWNVLGVEGTDTCEWVLVDLIDAIVHIMVPAARELYNLEELWSE